MVAFLFFGGEVMPQASPIQTAYKHNIIRGNVRQPVIKSDMGQGMRQTLEPKEQKKE